MPPPEPDEGFTISDRRGRQRADEPVIPTEARPPASPPARHEDEPTLEDLFVMLAGSAAVALGDVPDPMTGTPQHDLAQAAGVIDLLALLRKKTEGNRTPEETQLLDELLYDLQVRYVAATKRPG
jgi:hypothetical protein